jgi:hypothetical protein
MRSIRWLGASALILALMAPEAWGAAKSSASPAPRHRAHRAGANIDNSTHMDANNLDMVDTNHGSYAYDLLTGNGGLIYPKGSTKTAIFAAGPWIGAKVNGETRVAVGEYSQEYTPGPMLGGTFQSDIPRFKNYRIDRGNTTSADYLNWPVQDGAPTDSLGNPLLLGDATIWSVYNDADAGTHTNLAGSTSPLGVEIQQTTFAYNRSGALGNIIFIKFKILNKGGNQLDSTYFSSWVDPDLGGFTDDLVGCDTTLSLGYCYNSTNADQLYGATPPTVGFDFFRGPIVQVSPGVYDTLGMVSFNKYSNGTDPKSAEETYNFMKGLKADGSALHVDDDPLQPVTTFQVSGDPVTSTGWLDTNAGDRRMMLSTGPFSMAPGDSQEIVVALIVGQGIDALSSVTDLKSKDRVAQLVFDLNFDIPSPPPNPTVYVHPLDKGVRLVWGKEPVGTTSVNDSLHQEFHFEGYRIWQLPTRSGVATARVIATYDEVDSVGPIYSDLFSSTKGAFERTLVISGKNEGLRFSLDIKSDAFRGGSLVNNKDYYFAVTAYSFDVNNTVPFFIGVNQQGYISEVLESSISAQTSTPRGSNAVLRVNATQISGDDIGNSVVVEQLNQSQLADSVYHVTFAPDQSWSVTGVATGDTVLTGQTNVSGDFDYPVVRGFMPRVIGAPDPAQIFQLEAGGGTVDLIGDHPDSSGIYHLENYVDDTDITWFNFADGTFHDYEIRILPDTTEYCWEYNFGDPSAVATFKCPFEISDLGSCSYANTTDDFKVTVMVRDDDGSGTYTWGDRIYIRDIPYASVPWATPGLLSTDVNPANDDQTFGRIAFVQEEGSTFTGGWPPPERIRIRAGHFCTSDVFSFRILPVGSAPGTIVGRDLKKILAVPNPYYAHSQYELNQFDRVMKFTNIPASRKVTIRIFNLAGDLVRTIQRVATTPDEMSRAEIVWNLSTDHNLPVASGVYIYRVDVEGVGSKTDRLAVFTEQERLDNY